VAVADPCAQRKRLLARRDVVRLGRLHGRALDERSPQERLATFWQRVWEMEARSGASTSMLVPPAPGLSALN
jgi:hypothetical protein